MRQRRGEGLGELGAAGCRWPGAIRRRPPRRIAFRPRPALGLTEAPTIGGEPEQPADALVGRGRSEFAGPVLMREHEAGVVEIFVIVDAEGIPMPGMAVLDHRGDAAMGSGEKRCEDRVTGDEGKKLRMGDARSAARHRLHPPVSPRPGPHLLHDIGKVEQHRAQPVAAQAPALDLARA